MRYLDAAARIARELASSTRETAVEEGRRLRISPFSLED